MRHRVLLIGALASACSITAAATAHAGGGPTVTRSTTDSIDVDWATTGALDGASGNLHVGFLTLSDQAAGDFVEGFEFDYRCPASFVPTTGGRAAVAEAEAAGCEWLGDRYVEGGDISVHVRPGLTAARVTGTVNDVRGTTVAVDLRVTAIAPKTYDVQRDILPGQYRRFTRTTARHAGVSGSISDLDVADAAVTSADIRRVRSTAFDY